VSRGRAELPVPGEVIGIGVSGRADPARSAHFAPEGELRMERECFAQGSSARLDDSRRWRQVGGLGLEEVPSERGAVPSDQ